MKDYIRLTIKKYIPFLVVAFVFSFFATVTPALASSSTRIIYPNIPEFMAHSNESFESETMMLLVGGAIPMFVLTLIGPLFANSYRNSLESADIFNQYGKNKKNIRFANNFVILGMILAALFTAYLFSVIILMIKQLPNYGKPIIPNKQTPYDTDDFIKYVIFNFQYFIPFYGIYFISGILNYFISYFLVTRSNNWINSVLTLICGYLILSIGVMTPIWLENIYESQIAYDYKNWLSLVYLIPTRSLTVISTCAWSLYLFTGKITGISPEFDYPATKLELASFIISIITLVIFLAISALTIYSFFKEKESSGEHCGRAKGRGNLQTIIFNVAFGLIGLWVGPFFLLVSYLGLGEVTVILFLMGMTFFAAVYYVFTGLIRRNFKLDLLHIILFASNLLISTLNGVILLIIHL